MQMEEMTIEECKFCGHLTENHRIVEAFDKSYISCLSCSCIRIVEDKNLKFAKSGEKWRFR